MLMYLAVAANYPGMTASQPYTSKGLLRSHSQQGAELGAGVPAQDQSLLLTLELF